MSQLAFQLDAPPDLFKRFGPRNASVCYARSPGVVRWKTGAPDTLKDHVGALILPGGTSKRLDLTSGLPYVLLTYQGAGGVLYLASGDSAGTLDSLLPGGSLWGILAWVDLTGIKDWQQT